MYWSLKRVINKLHKVFSQPLHEKADGRPAALNSYDIILLSTSGDGLRRHLSSLELLCKELKTEVNTAKTKISVMGRTILVERNYNNY